MIKKLLHLSRSSQTGQSATEFAFMFPVFIAVFVGLTSVSLIFFSYVTMQLAVREGAGTLIRNPQATIYSIRNTICSNAFAFDKSQISVKVEPPDNAGTTAVQCSSLNVSEGQYLYWTQGIPVKVTAFYMVPIPTVSMPTMSNGSSSVVLAPFQLVAFSIMTIE
jgi:Flp pilus assembly protein TadG